MKYLKSFLGILILLFLTILIITPVIGVALLGAFINQWFLFGEIAVIPITIYLIIKIGTHDMLDWVAKLIFTAFNK